ncbi:MAG: branched-chain amino acid ABC transporter permease [Burkholderiales bacterium]|nr:MAG: branched-chain amino acid ABC transporter permease [Burkholderiales bacterium]
MHNSIVPSATGFNKGRWTVWSLFAVVLLAAPFVFTSNLAVTMLSQMGIAIIACLSYNILLGQGGMLSFGHAVYTGLGSYVAMHALNSAAGGHLPIPVTLLPLVGGVAGLFFAVLFGYVTTKKAGTTFAMITLGMAELVFAMSLMFSEFFGGEAGVSGNRVIGEAFMGITYGPPRQVYFLIAVYTFICVGLMFAFTRTPLGRILNAVRDNPERVEFIGYNTQKVRYLSFMIAGFFAGIAGGLGALNFEIVTAEVVGAGRSGAYLLFTFLGGATIFFGPIIGGILMVLASVLLSELTKAWLLYLGLIFLFMVMYAPGGVASLIMINVRVAAHGLLKRVLGSYALLTVFGLIMLSGAGAMIEMMYHLQLNAGQNTELRFMGANLDAHSVTSWVGSVVVLLVGLGLFEWVRRRFMLQWHDIQVTIEKQTQQRETA